MRHIEFNEFPKNVQIDVNNFCNLHCPICANSARRAGNKIKPENMSLENFKIIVSKLNFPAHFTFGNKSEPMLNPRLFEMIKHLRAKNKGAYTQILTNFTLLENFSASEVVNSGVNQILVGLDGINPEMYAKYRVGGDFNTVIKNIKDVQEYKKKINSALPEMEIVFVVFKHNENYLEEAKKMAQGLGCKIQFRRTDIQQGFEHWAPESKTFEDDKTAPVWISPVASPCAEPWLKMNIYSDGEVCTCCSEQQISAGNIFKQSFDEIWNGSLYKNTRAFLTGAQTSCDVPCLECPVYKNNNLNAFSFNIK
jgi:MoaA/NifB/PqqE/SkfB family radical SAM enzyme